MSSQLNETPVSSPNKANKPGPLNDEEQFNSRGTPFVLGLFQVILDLMREQGQEILKMQHKQTRLSMAFRPKWSQLLTLPCNFRCSKDSTRGGNDLEVRA